MTYFKKSVKANTLPKTSLLLKELNTDYHNIVDHFKQVFNKRAYILTTAVLFTRRSHSSAVLNQENYFTIASTINETGPEQLFTFAHLPLGAPSNGHPSLHTTDAASVRSIRPQRHE